MTGAVTISDAAVVSDNPDTYGKRAVAAAFAGSGIAPVGRITTVRDQFINLQPQTVRGLDLGFCWTMPKTDVGKFEFAVNATRLLKFSRPPGDTVDQLVEARANGAINAATPLLSDIPYFIHTGESEY